jgi:ribonuclease HII
MLNTKIPLPESILAELSTPNAMVAGVDEVGRGALFGAVVAAAVILPVSSVDKLITLKVQDSKLLSAKKRTELVPKIKKLVTDWQIGVVESTEIDQINILQASLKAMNKAVNKLNPQPDLCLVDGKDLIPCLSLPQFALIKGDQRSPVIAAASIIAKVWRDDLIVADADKYPEYDLIHNKGYGTKKHRQALAQYGLTPQHRTSFRIGVKTK